MVGVADAIGWASKQIMDRVPKADLDQRYPDFIRDQLPGTWLLGVAALSGPTCEGSSAYRPGAGLLVGNDSGGNVPPDTFVFTLAFCSYLAWSARSINSRRPGHRISAAARAGRKVRHRGG